MIIIFFLWNPHRIVKGSSGSRDGDGDHQGHDAEEHVGALVPGLVAGHPGAPGHQQLDAQGEHHPAELVAVTAGEGGRERMGIA